MSTRVHLQSLNLHTLFYTALAANAVALVDILLWSKFRIKQQYKAKAYQMLYLLLTLEQKLQHDGFAKYQLTIDHVI